MNYSYRHYRETFVGKKIISSYSFHRKGWRRNVLTVQPKNIMNRSPLNFCPLFWQSTMLFILYFTATKPPIPKRKHISLQYSRRLRCLWFNRNRCDFQSIVWHYTHSYTAYHLIVACYMYKNDLYILITVKCYNVHTCACSLPNNWMSPLQQQVKTKRICMWFVFVPNNRK